jgi:hypothetical protein
MIQEYIDRVELAIQKGKEDKGDTKLIPEIFQLPGMSSREGRILLNELVKDGDKYLEIGVHKGSTFISAMYKNNAKAVAIDNFSQFGGQEVKNWFDQACKDHNVTNFNFINHDCFNLTEEQKSLVNDINVYFYDGDHREQDQEQALTYYIDSMSDVFIFIVDDWNHAPARSGTKLGLEKTNVKVHKEWELNTEKTGKGWHNALYVAVLSK